MEALIQATAAHRRELLKLAALACLLAGSGLARAQARALELQVKAAYIYNFSSFVEWPDESFADQDSPLHIGIVEHDALADQLVQTIAGRTVRGHALVVRKLRRTDPLDDLHLLFVGPLPRAQFGELLAAARRRPTLVVTQVDGALQQGSMVNFVLADERLRFEVAPKTAEQSGLTISARLLAVALKVEGK